MQDNLIHLPIIKTWLFLVVFSSDVKLAIAPQTTEPRLATPSNSDGDLMQQKLNIYLNDIMFVSNIVLEEHV